MVHGASGCQLYVILPPEKDASGVSEFVEAGDFTSFSSALLQSRSDGTVDRDYAQQLLHLAHGANIPLLLENDIPAAAEIGADGIHIRADESLYGEARSTLGDDAIIGVDCGPSRHAGLTFAELGADYIAFSDTRPSPDEAIGSHEDLITWWAETVTVPCVAWDVETMEMSQRLARAGADFAALNALLWSHPKGPAAAASDLHACIEKLKVPA
jgi:thiamine-phosphate pyrophosphorylase